MTDSRNLVIIALIGLIAAGCAQFKLKPEEVEGASRWHMDGAVPARSHIVRLPLDPPLEHMWTFNAEAGFGASSPLMYGKAVMVGTRNGFLMGVHAETGKRLGRKKFDHPIEGGVVLKDDIVYIPFALGKTSLIAFDVLRGKEKWELEGDPIEAGLILSDTTIFLVDNQSTVRAIGQEGGAHLWNTKLDTLANVVASPVATGSDLFVVDEHGLVTKLRKRDGLSVWQEAVGAPVYNSPAIGNGMLFIPTTRGRLVVLDLDTGRTSGGFSLPDSTVRFSSPAYDARKGEIYVGSTDGFLRSINARTGALLWQYQTGSAVVAAPLVTDRTVFVGSMSGLLTAIDRDSGKRVWETKLEGRIRSAMAAQEDRLIVLSEQQKVNMLKMVPSEPVSAP